jgi:tetratricopeptide (TPR) repeat protein
MCRFVFRYVAVSLLLFPGLGQAQTDGKALKKASPGNEQIQRWIRELGDAEFTRRENASKALWEAGRLAEKYIEEATKSEDPEVRRRSLDLHNKFKWGIFPDTPPKFVERIERYRSGEDVAAKAAIIQEWLDEGAEGRAAFTRISAAEDKGLLDEVCRHAATAFYQRGYKRSQQKDYDQACKDFDLVIQLDPRNIGAFVNRGVAAYRGRQNYAQAIKDFEDAIRLNPDHALALNNKAWLLATCPDKRVRDGKKALELATKACELTEWKAPMYFDSLAGAYAELGNFDKAVEWMEKALEDEAFTKKYGDEGRAHLKNYREKTPFRE